MSFSRLFPGNVYYLLIPQLILKQDLICLEQSIPISQKECMLKINGEIGVKNIRSWRTDARVRPVQNILNFKYFKFTRGIVLSEFSREQNSVKCLIPIPCDILTQVTAFTVTPTQHLYHTDLRLIDGRVQGLFFLHNFLDAFLVSDNLTLSGWGRKRTFG